MQNKCGKYVFDGEKLIYKNFSLFFIARIGLKIGKN